MGIPSRATEISLEHFPVYHPPDMPEHRTQHIAGFLQGLLEKKLNRKKPEVLLPSLTLLVMFFETPYLTLYDALQALRFMGFDFSLNSLENPIRIWRNDP